MDGWTILVMVWYQYRLTGTETEAKSNLLVLVARTDPFFNTLPCWFNKLLTTMFVFWWLFCLNSTRSFCWTVSSDCGLVPGFESLWFQPVKGENADSFPHYSALHYTFAFSDRWEQSTLLRNMPHTIGEPCSIVSSLYIVSPWFRLSVLSQRDMRIGDGSGANLCLMLEREKSEETKKRYRTKMLLCLILTKLEGLCAFRLTFAVWDWNKWVECSLRLDWLPAASILIDSSRYLSSSTSRKHVFVSIQETGWSESGCSGVKASNVCQAWRET